VKHWQGMVHTIVATIVVVVAGTKNSISWTRIDAAAAAVAVLAIVDLGGATGFATAFVHQCDWHCIQHRDAYQHCIDADDNIKQQIIRLWWFGVGMRGYVSWTCAESGRTEEQKNRRTEEQNNKTTKQQNNKRTKENIQNTFNGMPWMNTYG
jgi:hypothetical protein